MHAVTKDCKTEMFLFTLFSAGDEQFCGAVIVKIAIS
jgi:hypothetical protein